MFSLRKFRKIVFSLSVFVFCMSFLTTIILGQITYQSCNVTLHPLTFISKPIETRLATSIAVTQRIKEQFALKQIQTKLETMSLFLQNCEKYRIDDRGMKALLFMTKCEAGNEPLSGQIAVIEVALKRVTLPKYQDMYDVLTAPGQYDYYVNLNTFDYNTIPDSVYQAVFTCLTTKTNESKGALYFKSNSCKASSWWNTLKVTTKIGNHTFYAPYS